MNARLKHLILRSLTTTLLGCGTFVASSLTTLVASANSQQVCLIAPNSGAIFVREEGGTPTGENWPNRSLAESFEVPGQDAQSRFVYVSLSTGQQGYVSKSVIAPAHKCLDGLEPQDRPEPARPSPTPISRPAPTLDSSPGILKPVGNSSNPFNCGLGERAQDCNRDALERYASEGKHIVGYDEARQNMFQKIDVYTDSSGNRVVRSVYSKDVYKVGSGIPSANNNGVNTEHTWPQSKLKQFSNFNTTRADLFHLFPSDAKTNSDRGNFPFSECSGEDNVAGHLCQDRNSFEPPTWHKGQVARAMFYMSTVYNMSIEATQEKTLRSWHASYPVSDTERARAEKIYQYQGNRNPFIDHPEWVNLISDF